MSEPFVLDAAAITRWQSCRRRYLLGAEWRSVRWRPKTLVDACLRRGIYKLSHAVDIEAVVTEAQAELMEAAADPGLDIVGSSPYVLAKDLCAMLDTILRSVARLVLLVLHDVPLVRLNSLVEWQPSAWADDSGELHRWVTVDRITEDRMAAEFHSWACLGDVAVTGCPLSLHVVEIGQLRRGQLHVAVDSSLPPPVHALAQTQVQQEGRHGPVALGVGLPRGHADAGF